jgi:hypothetical protein
MASTLSDDADQAAEIPDWYDNSFDPYCLELGRLSTIWAALEHAIDQLIWELSCVAPNIGACLTAQMIGPGPRMRALLALVHALGGDDSLLT